MKALKIFILIPLVAIYFTGCVTLYKPNVVHSPMLREQGQLNTTGSIGLSGSGLSNVQAAYALTNHMGLMVDGMWHTRKVTSADSSVDKLKIGFIETGVGYFTNFGELKSGLFQVYGGVGYGNTTEKIYYPKQSNPEVKAQYFNVFIQPGIGYANGNFELSFDTRMNYVNLYNIHAYMFSKFEWWNTDSRYYRDTTLSFMLLEPTLTMKGGGARLKGVLQFGLTIPVVHAQTYFNINSASMLIVPLFKFSVGITYRFGIKKKEVSLRN